MRILGIDPGLGTTGYGIIDQKDQLLNVVTYGGIVKSTKASFTENLLLIPGTAETFPSALSHDPGPKQDSAHLPGPEGPHR